MWNTSSKGDRRLEGCERALFVAGSLSLIEDLREREEDDPLDLGIAGFDSIPVNQRVWCALWVADHLLGSEDPPDLFAWNEGVVTAVFAVIHVHLDFEIDAASETKDKQERTYWRDLIHRAWMEVVHPELEFPSAAGEGENQDLESTDAEAWHHKIEVLSMDILHDDDASDDGIMDLPPEAAAKVKDEMDIPDDYYSAAPPALTLADRRRLVHLYRSLRTEDNRLSR